MRKKGEGARVCEVENTWQEKGAKILERREKECGVLPLISLKETEKEGARNGNSSRAT